MILDGQLKFSAAQAITASAASTNYIDVSEARNIGLGKDIYVATTIDVAMTDSGSDSSVDVHLYGDSTSTFTPDGDQLMYTIPAASAAGAGPFYGKISPSMVAGVLSGNFQYLEVYYNVNNGNLTTGSFTSFLVLDIAGFQAYKKGYTIS